jgi:serine/threonine-protein kinase
MVPPPGAGQIPVPDLVGLTEADARQALQGLGLRIRVSRVPTSAAPGTVLAVQPPAGTMVNPGDVVTVVVAAAPPAPTTKQASAAPSSSR